MPYNIAEIKPAMRIHPNPSGTPMPCKWFV